MSSTTGVQNLLVNVFRPVYSYDPIASVYTVKLEMSNIDTYSGNALTVFTAAVGDANSNVYVGSNAGNTYTNLRACSNVVALGYSAGSGISNVSNSTYIGNAAGLGGSTANAVIGIGTSAGGNGTSNIFIGNATSATGNNNILIGHGITATSNALRLGSTIYGNTSTNWIGIGTSSPYDVNDRLDVSGNTYIYGQVGVNITPGNRTLDVNGDFRASDTGGDSIDFHSGSFTVTASFKRTLNSTAITQPIIQYGKASGTGANSNTTVTLPTAYSDANYIVQVSMGDTTPAEMSVNVTSSNSFTIYWANAGGGTHTLFWTTFGT